MTMSMNWVKIQMKMKVSMKCYDNESQNEMMMKIEIVGGWGFPP